MGNQEYLADKRQLLVRSGQDSNLRGCADFYEVCLRVNLEPVIPTGMLFPCHVSDDAVIGRLTSPQPGLRPSYVQEKRNVLSFQFYFAE